ncbi:MAG: flagellar biosynthetic protein FliO [Nitrospinae bacterium]|nr:flagellar biosynthetic protein FliO [Nitrospinota bacterium]
MKRYLFLLICFIIFCKAAYAKSLSDSNYIKDLKTYSDDKELRLVVDFKKELSTYKGPTFYKKSIQIDLPNTYLNPSKRVIEIGDEMISQIRVVQQTRDTVRMRLMYADDGDGIEERFSLSIEDKSLVISIKRANVVDVEGILNTLFPEDSIDKEEIKGEISPSSQPLTPNSVEKRPVPEATKDSGIDQDKGGYLNYEEPVPPPVPDLFSATLKMIVSLIIVLSLILIIYYLVKRFLLKDNGLIGNNRLIKVISTSFIGPKKAITLVEVANEILVLGISNNNISMLTRLENKGTIDSLKGGKDIPHRDGDGGEGFSEELNRFVYDDHKEKSDSVMQVSQMIKERLKRLRRGG